MKKILFVASQNPPYRKPFFSLLSNKMKKEKNIIDILFTHEKSIRYKKVWSIGYKKYKIHPSLWITPIFYDLTVFLPTDALHIIDNLMMTLTCLVFNKKYILWGERWDYKKVPLKDRISLFLYGSTLRNCAAYVAAGSRSAEWAKKNARAKKIFIAPNASSVRPTSYKIKKKQKKDGKKVILFVGRLIKRKGVDFLVNAFSKIKDKKSELIIVGGEDFYELGEKSISKDLKKQIKENNLQRRVKMLGHVKKDELHKYFQMADLFVMPSITKKISEPWGLTLNEAMEFALPVIATDAVGAAYDLIEDGKNGYMIKEKDVEELKKAIEKIIEKNKNNKMGKKSEQIIRNKFTYEKMVGGFIRAIKFSLNKK